MAAALVEQAPAKINLTLRVLGRRADGYHALESLVAFAELSDTLTLHPGDVPSLDVSGPFAAASGPSAANLVLKAFDAMRQLATGLKAGRFSLVKNIPVAAGLGGGSADAAAALRLLARFNGIAVGDARLMQAARALGADVPVCLDPQVRIMRGVGDELSALVKMPPLAGLLVNPGVALATHDVFAKFAAGHASEMSIGHMPGTVDAAIGYLALYDNDLTPAAISCVPAIAAVLENLRALAGVQVTRMSGSGATCFALFTSAAEAAAAARQLSTARRDWWVYPTMLGSLEKHS
ncbi:MAG TPA: 4-(cytidine 5'-diphospho)-2-C-methyl-D-erythritol kinase [Pseudolabrys sp.]